MIKIYNDEMNCDPRVEFWAFTSKTRMTVNHLFSAAPQIFFTALRIMMSVEKYQEPQLVYTTAMNKLYMSERLDLKRKIVI